MYSPSSSSYGLGSSQSGASQQRQPVPQYPPAFPPHLRPTSPYSNQPIYQATYAVSTPSPLNPIAAAPAGYYADSGGPTSASVISAPQSTPPPTTTATPADKSKEEQIIQQFYSKVAQVIVQSRATTINSSQLQSNLSSSGLVNPQGSTAAIPTKGKQSTAAQEAAYSSSPRPRSGSSLPQAGSSSAMGSSQFMGSASVTSNTGGGGTGRVKSNKWFNLETPDVEPLRSELKYWRAQVVAPSPSSNTSPISAQSQSASGGAPPSPPPPLIIDLYLDISDLTSSHVLLLKDEISLRRQKIGSEHLQALDPAAGGVVKKKRILLETWQLTLSHPVPNPPPEVPIMYKKCAMFFRSLYSFTRILPAFRLFRKLKKALGPTTPLKIGYRLSTSRFMPLDEAGLDLLHSSGDMRRGISEYSFGGIDTSHGVFNLHVTYRTECDFTVDETEPLLNSKFVDMDDQFFAPKSFDANDMSHASLSQSLPQRKLTAKQPSRTSLLSRATERLLPSSLTSVLYGSGATKDSQKSPTTATAGENNAPARVSESLPVSGSASAIRDSTGASKGGINIPSGSLPPHLRSAQYYYQHQHAQAKQQSSSYGSSPQVEAPRYRAGSITGRDILPGSYSSSPRRDYLASAMSTSPGSALVGREDMTGMRRTSSGLSVNSVNAPAGGERGGPNGGPSGTGSGATGGSYGTSPFGFAGSESAGADGDLQKAVDRLGGFDAPPFLYQPDVKMRENAAGLEEELTLAAAEQMKGGSESRSAQGSSTDRLFGVSPPFDLIQRNAAEQRGSSLGQESGTMAIDKTGQITQQRQMQTANITADLEDLMRSVESRRKSLQLRTGHGSMYSAVAGIHNSGSIGSGDSLQFALQGSESSKRPTRSKNALSRFIQLKELNSSFSDSLMAAAQQNAGSSSGVNSGAGSASSSSLNRNVPPMVTLANPDALSSQLSNLSNTRLPSTSVLSSVISMTSSDGVASDQPKAPPFRNQTNSVNAALDSMTGRGDGAASKEKTPPSEAAVGEAPHPRAHSALAYLGAPSLCTVYSDESDGNAVYSATGSSILGMTRSGDAKVTGRQAAPVVEGQARRRSASGDVFEARPKNSTDDLKTQASRIPPPAPYGGATHLGKTWASTQASVGLAQRRSSNKSGGNVFYGDPIRISSGFFPAGSSDKPSSKSADSAFQQPNADDLSATDRIRVSLEDSQGKSDLASSASMVSSAGKGSVVGVAVPTSERTNQSAPISNVPWLGSTPSEPAVTEYVPSASPIRQFIQTQAPQHLSRMSNSASAAAGETTSQKQLLSSRPPTSSSAGPSLVPPTSSSVPISSAIRTGGAGVGQSYNRRRDFTDLWNGIVEDQSSILTTHVPIPSLVGGSHRRGSDGLQTLEDLMKNGAAPFMTASYSDYGDDDVQKVGDSSLLSSSSGGEDLERQHDIPIEQQPTSPRGPPTGLSGMSPSRQRFQSPTDGDDDDDLFFDMTVESHDNIH
ncbi:autophagy protein 13 [Chytridiales sp. JEL 0842]|nr:autophagy protein 13 [Chytridiales sp. JEL 0842]